jgi:hypothetical protein
MIAVGVGGLMLMLLGSDYVHFGSSNATAAHFAGFEPRTHVETDGRFGERVKGYTGVHQRTQKHVAAYTGKAFKIASSHR